MRSILVGNANLGAREDVRRALVPTFQVTFASHAAELLAHAEHGTFELAVLAVHLPPCGAAEVAGLLRQRGHAMPILVAGPPGRELEQCGRLAPDVAVLETPFGVRSLQWAVARTLRRRIAWHDDVSGEGPA